MTTMQVDYKGNISEELALFFAVDFQIELEMVEILLSR
jgi:hypothetical protein